MTPPPSLQELIDTVQQDSPSDDLLDLLETARTTVSQLEDAGDALLGHFVDRCRRAGRSWSDISSALGVSKQAVHKRFAGPIADRLISATTVPTFERFTDRARAVLAAAEVAARDLHRDQVGSEHLLLGLFAATQGLAARALGAMHIGRDEVLAALAARRAEGTPAAAPAGDPAPSGRLPFAPDAAEALRHTLAEAVQLGHNYIGTEHILLGLLHDPDQTAARTLASLGATPEETRVRLTEMLREMAYRKSSGA
ncbi:MAG TPA: Clp protease N-terminal domain-containing protein [Streptosporangiaceae bacterium]|nr:Clp protease N-terminal domain-containing protein [Streptosporangiaceae bacterium]